MGSCSYVPLWTKSNYSFLRGASHPEELVERAGELGLGALALTDVDGVYGIVRAHGRARTAGVRLLIGAELTVGETKEDTDPVVVLAQSREGYRRLCGLISRGRAEQPKGESLLSATQVAEAGDELIVLCPRPRPLPLLREAHGDRVYALCTRHLGADERRDETLLREAAKSLDVPVAGGVEVLYHLASRRPLHDVVSCIRHGTTVDAAGVHIRRNAEHDLKPCEAMDQLFADDPLALARTVEIAKRCTFSLDEIDYRYPAEHIPDGKSESDWLRELTMKGAAVRYHERIPDDVRAQIERELEIIHDLSYGGYFLTMWEIVQFCRRTNIICQGRGSAANSAVCYCLGITAVDPVRMDLLFERFLSRERAEPPDIDLDIEHERREEVIQWVYERYGRRHAAMVANFVRYRARSAIRDVGKALGISATAIDRAARVLSYHDQGIDAGVLSHAGIDPQSPAGSHLLRLCNEIVDFPRHLSIHPGGFLLGHEPVDGLVPIEPATMEGRTVIQWDKYDVEELGLFKVDLLGLGALTQIHRCFDLLRTHGGPDLQMATVPAEDPVTYAMISGGDTVGVFQIESRAQMAMLPRLRPRTFYDLVIEVAIVRPGPIQGDMVHPYLRRRSGQEPVDFPHPNLERVLAKTLGVPIFQEQVMKLAVLVAGYTPGEADQLRRDMGAWRSSGRIDAHHDRIVGRMTAYGISEAFAERVFSQIRGFGEYGFPESHAASFALIAYITAWLRCHHPAAFTCSLLNAQPMGFYSPATLVEDARRRGVEVRPVAVGTSEWDCTLEPNGKDGGDLNGKPAFAIRMGYRYVKGLGTRERGLLERAPGPYTDLEDFVRRTRLNQKSLHLLAESGAFANFGLDRRDAVWRVRGLQTTVEDVLEIPSNVAPSEEQPLFRPTANAEAILWDYRTSMHSTRGHPIETIRPTLRQLKIPTAESLRRFPTGRKVDYVGMVICRQRPGTAGGVTFFTLEDETGFVNLVVWRDTFAQHQVLAKTALLLGVTGKIQSADGVVHLIANTLWAPSLDFRKVAASSRDFH